MTIIQNKTIIKAPVDRVYAFLADVNNHEQLMPDDIGNWSSTYDDASFTIKNMGDISIRIAKRIDNSEVVLKPSVKTPFEVTLRWRLNQKEATITVAKLVVEADLTIMMKMLATGTLQKLVDHQVHRLRKAFPKKKDVIKV